MEKKSPPLKRHFIYWIIPTLFALICVALYYSGSDALVDWITPRTNTVGWQASGNRELGILESAQHGLLLVTTILLARGCWMAEYRLQRLGFALAGLVMAFLFLEEINYGQHYFEWIVGEARIKGDFNIHNTTGNSLDIMKRAMDIFVVVWFAILPIVAHYKAEKWLTYFTPTRMFIVTLIAAQLVTLLAHYLSDHHYDVRESMKGNNSEFTEVFIYYILFLYSILMVRRPWPAESEKART